MSKVDWRWEEGEYFPPMEPISDENIFIGKPNGETTALPKTTPAPELSAIDKYFNMDSDLESCKSKDKEKKENTPEQIEEEFLQQITPKDDKNNESSTPEEEDKAETTPAQVPEAALETAARTPEQLEGVESDNALIQPEKDWTRFISVKNAAIAVGTGLIVFILKKFIGRPNGEAVGGGGDDESNGAVDVQIARYIPFGSSPNIAPLEWYACGG